VSNFVAVATGVSRGRIFLSLFNSQTPKTLAVLGARILVIFSIQIEFIVYFVSNFVAMATAVGRGRICLTSFNSQIP